MPDDFKRKPNLWERQQEKLLRQAREDAGKRARFEKSRFGRMMLQTASRTVEGWEPDLQEDERTELQARAERVTLLNQIVSGYLTLTNKRLIFAPYMELSWIPWAIGTSELPLDNLRARQGVFLSRGVYPKFLSLTILLPGWLHFANLKVTHRRRAWWLRVEDPRAWADAILSADRA